MRNAAQVQNLPRKPRVAFISFWIFRFTWYFFHEFKTSIAPNYSFLLTLTSMNQDSRGHGGKTIEHPFYWVGSLPSPPLPLATPTPPLITRCGGRGGQAVLGGHIT